MVDYQSNSKKSKEKAKPEDKKLEKVIAGEAVVKKKTLGSRLKGIFFGGDFNTAGQYVVGEVLLPALRNLVVEGVSKGADRLIYGESGRRYRPPPSYGARVQYHNPLSRAEPRNAYLPDQRPINQWAGGRKSFDDVILPSKDDADTVVERLIDVIEQYEVVSVADLYELLGLQFSPIDNKWGWTHMSGIEVAQVRDGWKISFPPLEEI